MILSEQGDSTISENFVFEVVTPEVAGRYRLYYQNGNCKSPEVEFLLDVFEEDAIDLPNVFTPNGDGVNDVFRPLRPANSSEFTLVIFNRWGHKVFEPTNIELGWDGTINGQDAPDANYIYSVTYKSCGGSNSEKRGALKLLR